MINLEKKIGVITNLEFALPIQFRGWEIAC